MKIQQFTPPPQPNRPASPANKPNETPPGDQVELSGKTPDPKEAKEAEGKQLRQLAKPFAIAGGVAGAAAAGAAAAAGGALGALVGSTVGVVLGVAGLIGGGIAGGWAAAEICERKNIISAPGLFLVLGGVVAGAAAGGAAGLYGGGALGALAGAKGGLLAAGVGAIGGAPIGALAGGIGRAAVELSQHPEKYPETLKELKKD
jgi:hypothetical protein